MKTHSWTEDFAALDTCGGSICFICEDDEDMIEVYLENGYKVDVGYLEENRCYYISIAKANEPIWKPEIEIPVYTKVQLPNELQQAIYRAAALSE